MLHANATPESKAQKCTATQNTECGKSTVSTPWASGSIATVRPRFSTMQATYSARSQWSKRLCNAMRRQCHSGKPITSITPVENSATRHGRSGSTAVNQICSPSSTVASTASAGLGSVTPMRSASDWAVAPVPYR